VTWLSLFRHIPCVVDGCSGLGPALGAYGRLVTTSEPFVTFPDQYRFGGATTLRGYREEQFRGSRVAWSNIEYRYLLSPRSRAFVFVDLGYYYRIEPQIPNDLSSLHKIEAFKRSFGFGIRLDTRLGIVGLELHTGLNGLNPFKCGQGNLLDFCGINDTVPVFGLNRYFESITGFFTGQSIFQSGNGF